MSRDINALLKAMNYQTKKIEAIYYKLALNFKMSESEFWILYTLSGAEQECSQQEISEELSVSKQTVNSAIQSLVQRKYIFLKLSDRAFLFISLVRLSIFVLSLSFSKVF